MQITNDRILKKDTKGCTNEFGMYTTSFLDNTFDTDIY